MSSVHEVDTPLYGVERGIVYGQFDRTVELDQRIAARQFSDQPLAPNFDPRPVSTKYAIMPILESRAAPTIAIEPTTPFQLESNFNPGTHRPPPNTYLKTIDTDSVLKNMTTSLQKGANQATYVPTPHSNLYKIQVPTNDRAPTHPGLFTGYDVQTLKNTRTANFQSFNQQNTFNNHTRVYLRQQTSVAP